jgi:hypothetical protein
MCAPRADCALAAAAVALCAAGCTILTEAKSYAYARCGPTGAFATSGSATTQVSRHVAHLACSEE